MTANFRYTHSIKILLDFTDRYSYDIFLVQMIYVKGILSVLNVTNNIFINIILTLILCIISAVVLKFV